MKIPLQLTIRNLSLSEAAEKDIRDKVASLDSHYDTITGCRVVVDAPHRHHHKGGMYDVRIDLTVPGKELVIRREADEDLYVAIRDAFDAARLGLEKISRRQRGDIKTHEEVSPHARVIRLFPAEGYGFLQTNSGREIYFHRNSVLNGGFDRLTIGFEVRFVEEQGEKGPQASTVEIPGRHPR